MFSARIARRGPRLARRFPAAVLRRGSASGRTLVRRADSRPRRATAVEACPRHGARAAEDGGSVSIEQPASGVFVFRSQGRMPTWSPGGILKALSTLSFSRTRSARPAPKPDGPEAQAL